MGFILIRHNYTHNVMCYSVVALILIVCRFGEIASVKYCLTLWEILHLFSYNRAAIECQSAPNKWCVCGANDIKIMFN